MSNHNNWQTFKLGQIASTTSGGTPSRKNLDYYGGSIPWVKSGELNDSYIECTEETITLIGLKNSSAKLFPPETLLIAMYGATVGRTAILKKAAATNQAVCAVFTDDTIDTSFLRFQLIYIRPEILKQRYGGAQPNISQNVIRNLTVSVPPLIEQRKIAAVLNLVQQAIEQQERLIDLTTELIKTLMHKLFKEGLYGELQKETEIGLVPESWCVDSMKSFISNSKYGLSQKGQDSGPIPILRMTNQVGGYIDTHNLQYVDIPNDVLEKYRVCRGDLLFNRTNSFELVGRTALFDILPRI